MNKERIENLRAVVRKVLNQNIDGDYVLLDVPNHSNIGDTLIWEGELKYLEELKYKCLYTSNIFTYDSKKVPKNAIILLHGGGNFGDVWSMNQKYRNQVITDFPNNKIIIFPQTLHYHNEQNAINDSKLYKKHPNLIICTRDQVSLEIAQKYFPSNNIYMLPDMAFFNDFSEFVSTSKTNKTLLLERMDKELGNVALLQKQLETLHKSETKIEVKDWPGFYKQGTLQQKADNLYNFAEIVGSKILLKSPLKFLVNDAHGLRGKRYKERRIKTGIKFINHYDVVYSTRLHGFILAVLLNKKVFIFDNSYGKNKNFFETWLKDFENVKLISK
ncbi:polysaccharide pyruvyl transferase family protein [Chryseobacterium pennipullorum]|uniref:Polysaccharide pyruvyl transferase n=1 Tax=Chryseobacterium pennipullorum TaxID=2258963 RepID=A0A3D9B7D1_9FLAO|nr:polysaccharide pyruvyl transferase family protein [Chryseobacterium pennipullorum]REC49610.1 polysaccharide pyruvyl transferase [Chryseobacterium pennipullorum]